MTKQLDPNSDRDRAPPSRRRAAGGLHARVYTLLIVFTAWFALAVWGFASGGLSDYLLVIVSGFIFVVVALQLILSRVARRRDEMKGEISRLSLRDWAAADFEIWDDKLSGRQAAIHILLPIAAAAIGMTAFAIVFIVTTHGGV